MKDNFEIKPRKWLLVILIIITIVIGVFLGYKGVLVIKKEIDRQRAETNKIKEKMNERSNEVDETINNIKEQMAEQEKQSKINSFNRTYEFRSGSQYAASISYLLDDVITNNKKNNDRLISVVYNSTNTTNPEELKNLKKSLEDWHKYEVSIDYDNEGYVNKITIEY